MGLLGTIHEPKVLRSLDLTELKTLAQEIRQEMIDVVSKNGGHLAPNLGVVELTLALHRIFDSPYDKIVWDVGHQTYVHKLLTGRLDRFKTIRKYQGLSGFPKRAESTHDCFETGHSSTSISAAVGFAKARDVLRESHHVVAVIGDGAMTGGMAYEALNHAGHSETNLIVVLNDNEMSISPNVGAMSTYLNRLRTDPLYDKRKEDLEYLLKRIPGIGTKVAKLAAKAKDSLKYLLVPGLIFEELGFTYLGPINGHDQALLEEVLDQAKNKKGPVLVHVLTHKGKGYKPAEENPDIFHGVGPFEPETGKVTKKIAPPTYTAVFGDTLCTLACQDSKIVAITAAMPSGTGLNSFAKQFPERFFDVGIAEQHAVTFAAGLAFGGLKPVVAIYSTFYQRAYDQVLHDVCLQQANVVLAIDRAGVVGDDGPTHHGVFDISMFRIIPNLIFMAPKDENELRHMLYTALQQSGPVALRYPRSVGQGVTLDETLKLLTIGKAEVLRDGRDVTLIGVGPLVQICLLAAQELRHQGVEAAVINLRYINPLDREVLAHYAHLTKKFITVEDHSLKGGMGSSILEFLEEEGIDEVTVERLGYPGFVDQGSIPQLFMAHGLSVKGIMQAAERLQLFRRAAQS
ncbi:1-deoxy-D-xylulose-5-phosphate synthase [Desulfosporosinus sp. BICA1-9]|uniref:1-deoxy-D-xylulose-5-phosphate synthase n=1 Tax=Desulfosporosinus sp. BICA1-9 TaxID=1531958 RepID=UPI00054C4746|nr:1-deoxy-D-xylulose-5-phosphate synthase [Desulfosporosinus sp. BICA1-9]KJS49825.1 MAG: 1-deoxy-D-xylulose-5-phosphate synthase [Peptococcaceae bacterium BRH_c23]KJS78782.1 MAG: 1-deoxy-D-xylulose-5-phosphate synthase [Desulfosporosinus sp. BICA1-9]HBW35536.1 1-deoxy-D-xylulose-5-phosphate synthase [Desulfosporosinus sp.]